MFPGRFVPRHYLLYKAESEMQHEKRLKIKENAVVDSGWILARGQRQPAGPVFSHCLDPIPAG
jgi:hypothetical protein